MSFDLKIVEGNLSLKDGDLQTVINLEKLEQDVLKIALTDAGANPLHPWYGSFLTRNIVGAAEDLELLSTIGKSQLTSALENLKKLQELQNQDFRRVTADEHIAAILEISVTRNPYDPRQIEVLLKIMSKGRRVISTGFSITS